MRFAAEPEETTVFHQETRDDDGARLTKAKEVQIQQHVEAARSL